LIDYFRFADQDGAAGGADATACIDRESAGTADIVWVIGKEICDRFTQDDAGRTRACQYSANAMRNYLQLVTEFAKYFGKSPDKLGTNETSNLPSLSTDRVQADARHRGSTVQRRCDSFSSRRSSGISSVISCLTLRTGAGCRRC